jgi:hypothetical protein
MKSQVGQENVLPFAGAACADERVLVLFRPIALFFSVPLCLCGDLPALS